MRIRSAAPAALFLALTTAAAAVGVDAAASSDVPVLRRMPLSELSDKALFACSCPGAVSFCTEWKEKWAKDVKDPEIRNQTVRECVIDMMTSITGRPWP